MGADELTKLSFMSSESPNAIKAYERLTSNTPGESCKRVWQEANLRRRYGNPLLLCL